MAQLLQFPSPEMRTGARFHPNQARRLFGKELPDLGAAKLAPDKHLSIRGNGMNQEDVLGEVETDRRWLHGDGSVFAFDRRQFRVFPQSGQRAPSTPSILNEPAGDP